MTEEAPLGLTIDPEAINRYLADQILESAIGEQLRKTLDKAVNDLGQSYRNPFESIVSSHIQQEVSRLIREEYSDQIAEIVRAKVTEQFTEELFDRLFEAFRKKAL